MEYQYRSPFFEPPQYSQIDPRAYRQELYPYNANYPQRVIREYAPVGLDRPATYSRTYKTYAPTQSYTGNRIPPSGVQIQDDLVGDPIQYPQNNKYDNIYDNTLSRFERPPNNYRTYQTPDQTYAGQRYRDINPQSEFLASEYPYQPRDRYNIQQQGQTSQIPQQQQQTVQQSQQQQPTDYLNTQKRPLSQLAGQIDQLGKDPKEVQFQEPQNRQWIEWQGVKEFAQILREIILYEQRVEKLRIRLCLQPDFNVLAIHNIFLKLQKDVLSNIQQQSGDQIKVQSEEFITIDGFTRGLRFFAIDSDPFDIELIFQKFDEKQSLKLMDYGNFYKLFYPTSKKDIFESKLNTLQLYTEFFNPKTHHLIETLFRLLLSQEDAYDIFRREIKRLEINFEKVWAKLNPMRKPEIEIEDLRRFLLDFGFTFNRDELSLYFTRLQKSKNANSIDFEQFSSEFNPRIDLLQKDNNIQNPIKNNLTKKQ